VSTPQTIVIIMSLGFIGFVTILHIIGKVRRRAQHAVAVAPYVCTCDRHRFRAEGTSFRCPAPASQIKGN